MGKLLWDNQSVIPYESATCRLDSLLTIGCQRYISDTCMFPTQRPLRLAVTDEEYPRGCHGVQPIRAELRAKFR